MIAAIVCEGPTDYPILEKMIRRLVPSIKKVLRLHPEVDEITQRLMKDTVPGWTGVQKWCQDRKGNLEDYLNKYISSMPVVLQVIHVDADIIDTDRFPCPPASNATHELRKRIDEWLDNKIPGNIVLATPSKSTETWILAVKRPGISNIECLLDSAEQLVKIGVLRRAINGEPDKDVASYIYLANDVADRIKELRKVCTEADRFSKEIERLFS